MPGPWCKKKRSPTMCLCVHKHCYKKCDQGASQQQEHTAAGKSIKSLKSWSPASDKKPQTVDENDDDDAAAASNVTVAYIYKVTPFSAC